MKRFFIETNASSEVLIGSDKKWFMFNADVNGYVNGVDVYAINNDEIVENLKKAEWDAESLNDLCRTFPGNVLKGDIDDLFPNCKVMEF